VDATIPAATEVHVADDGRLPPPAQLLPSIDLADVWVAGSTATNVLPANATPLQDPDDGSVLAVAVKSGAGSDEILVKIVVPGTRP
jgi:hypothetical protein